MRRIVLLSLVLVTMLVGCGGSVNDEECMLYCSKMADLGAHGSWYCVGRTTKVSGYCFTRTVETDANGDPMCYPANTAVGSLQLPDGTRWEDIKNADDRTSCQSSCLINTNGDKMSEKSVVDDNGNVIIESFRDSVINSQDKYEFLGAQLQEQCRLESNEH